MFLRKTFDQNEKGNVFMPAGKRSIVCIGGMNIDRKLYAKEAITYQTSNPVISSISVGGVARNIAENLGRLGENVTLISARGDDLEWQEIVHSSTPFMDLTHVAEIEGNSTGSYTAVLNMDGNLTIALADMDIFDKITPELLLKNDSILRTASCLIIDLNCPKKTIEFICSFSKKYHIPLVVIPVSSPKMTRLPSSLHAVSWLIVNKDETETFMKMTIKDDKDWKLSVEKWLNLGIQHVVVTNGEKGVMAGTNSEGIFYTPAISTSKVVDVTGAGDSFCSAVIHAWLNQLDMQSTIQFGVVNAYKTIMSTYTVRQDLSQKKLLNEMKEIFK